jgi:hypothetical protein
MPDAENDTDSDTSMLSDEDREIVERIRAERDRALATDPEAEDGLPPEKQDFPVGIRPDGTVNRVSDGADEASEE